ncbi:MAG: FGGY-family carbohydrate kinase [Scandinavium sp.]|uniref:FGGY-family carbohydrate kinase n=1 Tax=Scandinavium sp. TaxID=2830653 RepID=UPI003F2AE094
MTNSYVVGVDVGSGSVRAGIYNREGKRLAFATRPLSQFRPGGERVEQSSAEIWQHACEAVRESVSLAGIDAALVCAIGFDATCSLVAVDAQGKGLSVSPHGSPDHDIIMWMDHRADEETRRLNRTGDPALRYVGGEISIEMELPKVLWLKHHHPQTWEQAHRFFDLADFMVWKATGEDVASLCTLTCKWNYLAHEQRFSESLLSAVGLTPLLDKVPTRILPPGARAGQLTPQAAAELGLSTNVVVATGMIDAHAGGVALTAANPSGTVALISGTSNCHMISHPQPLMTRGVWGPYWSAMLPDFWLTEGGQSAAGALVDWTLKEHYPGAELFAKAKARDCHPVELLNEWVAALEAAEKDPTQYLHVLADHHGNRSPRARPDARGTVSGLTLEQGESALARLYLATLQAIAYGTRHILEVMRENGHSVERIALCGGASHNPLWLREYADVTGCDIQLMAEEDAVTLGAAITGAVASGTYPDMSAAAEAMVQPGQLVAANPARRAFHQRKYQVYLTLWDHQQQLNHLMNNDYDA